MYLKVSVNSNACDTDYGGEQKIDVICGEYRLDEIFRLPFFRVVIDEVIDGAVCFRLMEGGIEHYFVLENIGERAEFHRETGIGEDNFIFELTEDNL